MRQTVDASDLLSVILFTILRRVFAFANDEVQE